jgi:GT2 family glycosyltransferase
VTTPSRLPARPTVSVIVPNYNYAKTLPACLAAVRAQQYPVSEIIVVDDASTDDSAQIARASGCTLLEQPGNRGAAAARNAGAAASSGDVLFFVDSDVELRPDAVANAVELLVADPRCGCVHGIYLAEPLIDDGPVEHCRILHTRYALLRAAGYTTTMISALCAIPSRVFVEIGPFDERFRGAGGEDTEYSDRLAARYRILLTAAVAGRHDDDDRLLPLLRKQYRRGQLLRFQAGHRFAPGAVKVNSLTRVLTAGLTVATVPCGLIAAPLLAVPAGFAVLFAVADPGLSRLVRRERGVAFVGYFTAVHFLVNLAILAGVAAGVVRAAVDPRFGPTQRGPRHARTDRAEDGRAPAGQAEGRRARAGPGGVAVAGPGQPATRSGDRPEVAGG